MLPAVDNASPSMGVMLLNNLKEQHACQLADLRDCSTTAQLKRSERQKMAAEKFEALAKNDRVQSGWKIFISFFQALASVAMIAAGGILCATGAGVPAGAAMIAVGCCLLTMQVMQDAGVTKLIAKHDKQLQAKIDLGFSITSLILSLVTVAVSAIRIGSAVGQAALYGVQAMSSTSKGLATIGSGVATKSRLDTEAVAKSLEARGTVSNFVVKLAHDRTKERMGRHDNALAHHLIAQRKRISQG